MSILNSLRSGKFSSDRTIRQYCEEIWRVPTVPIKLLRPEEVTSGFMQ
jgi:starch phosphorylase